MLLLPVRSPLRPALPRVWRRAVLSILLPLLLLLLWRLPSRLLLRIALAL